MLSTNKSDEEHEDAFVERHNITLSGCTHCVMLSLDAERVFFES